jgi:hypothetical protein
MPPAAVNWDKVNRVMLDSMATIRGDIEQMRQGLLKKFSPASVTAYNYLAMDCFGLKRSLGVPDNDLIYEVVPTGKEYLALSRVVSVAEGATTSRTFTADLSAVQGFLGRMNLTLDGMPGPPPAAAPENAYESINALLSSRPDAATEWNDFRTELGAYYQTSLFDPGTLRETSVSRWDPLPDDDDFDRREER